VETGLILFLTLLPPLVVGAGALGVSIPAILWALMAVLAAAVAVKGRHQHGQVGQETRQALPHLKETMVDRVRLTALVIALAVVEAVRERLVGMRLTITEVWVGPEPHRQLQAHQ
jgi:hypothetical protein